LPHLEIFTKNLNKLHFNGSVRACQNILTKSQIDTIIEVCFDWLITPQKIAVKAYTMNTLYLFGLQTDWIHPNLKEIIKKDIIQQSKGCEARGKKILHLIDHRKNT